MNGFLNHIKIFVITAMGLVQCLCVVAQQTIAFDITTQSDNKRVFLFNTALLLDSVHLKNKAGKNLPTDNIYPSEYPHASAPEIVLFEAGGSILYIDTAGNFYIRDGENIEAKSISLKINIDTLGLGKKNLMIECSNRDLENLEIYIVPLDKYRVASTMPQVDTKLSFKLEDIIYGAKGKTPPRLLDLWKEQIQIDPADRRILYEYRLILPIDMVKRNKSSLIIYDLSNQVVAIYPDLKKTVNVIKRDNIISATYIYKVFTNNGTEEVKKGLIHYLSPEDEQKKLELQNQPPPPPETGESPE